MRRRTATNGTPHGVVAITPLLTLEEAAKRYHFKSPKAMTEWLRRRKFQVPGVIRVRHTRLIDPVKFESYFEEPVVR